MKKVAIVQSNYIPWKGYFDMIAAVDEFILFDEMQFTRRDWRNRNKIKTPQGLKWLTVPVEVKGKYLQTINETRMQGTDWAQEHLKVLHSCYKRAPRFDEAIAWVQPLYEATDEVFLSPMNERFLRAICGRLGITTKITRCEDYGMIDGKSERLADLCLKAGADVYVSGPAARGYLDETVFAQKDLQVSWHDYAGYPEYPQLWGAFEHGVSILDLIFNCGEQARTFMRAGQPS